MEFKPLPHEWMIVSIIGFFVSWLYVYGELGAAFPGARKWGAAFMVFFIIIFVATMVTITGASTDDEHLEHLQPRKR